MQLENDPNPNERSHLQGTIYPLANNFYDNEKGKGVYIPENSNIYYMKDRLGPDHATHTYSSGLRSLIIDVNNQNRNSDYQPVKSRKLLCPVYY